MLVVSLVFFIEPLSREEREGFFSGSGWNRSGKGLGRL